MDMTFLPAQEISNDGQPVIKVIGVGGAGGNAISHMIRKELGNVEFVAINTDIKALRNCSAEYKVQIGDKGTGAGARPEVGQELAVGAKEAIGDILLGTDMLFIAAGMGGGTGTGAAPIIAQTAKEMGILTVAVVTKPFSDEGKVKMRYAEIGLEQLSSFVNSLIIVHNEKLISELPEDATLKESFAAADDVLYNAVSGVSDIIHEEGYMQVDFEDVRTIMNEAGESMMGSAYAEGDNRAREAATNAIKSPLLEGTELTNAKGALIYIAAHEDNFKRSEFSAVLQEIRQHTSEDAIVKAGVVFDNTLGEKMKVTVLVTGFGRQKAYNSSSTMRTERVSAAIPREDAHGNRIENPLAKVSNSEKNNDINSFINSSSDEKISIPVFNSQFSQTASLKSELPSVMRSRSRVNAEVNETKEINMNDINNESDNSSDEETHDVLAGLVAGDETATVTNGDLSGLYIPAFMRKQAGSGGN